MTIQSEVDRCRLLLVVTAQENQPDLVKRITDVLAGGDMAALIVASPDGYQQSQLEELVRACHTHDVPIMLAEDLALTERLDADGVVISGDLARLDVACARFLPHKMVGFANPRSRHKALEAGDLGADFILFGSLGGDTHPVAHPKNLDLAQWWSQLMEIPCAVMGGNEIGNVVEAAAHGAEFVALGRAVFDDERAPGQLVGEANRLLDAHAPRFN